MLTLFFAVQLFSKIKFDKQKPEESLRSLVEDFENNPRSIDSIPKDFLGYFSGPALVNALNVQLPIPPKYNATLVENEMKYKNFKNTDELANYIINKFEYNIDRLNAIFYYEANNILYDKESLLTNSIKYKSLEEIFESKLGVCMHFALFMYEMAKKCKINDFKVEKYHIFTKTGVSDPNTIPDKFEITHAAILVTYNNNQFVSDPTWAAGSLLSDYNPSYFLKPIEKTLSTHFPEVQEVNLPFTFSYEQFRKIIPVMVNNKDFKVESHPFWCYDCYEGFMNFQFSCILNVSNIICNMKKVNGTDSFDECISIETISGKRKRFIVHVIFPTKGLFEISLWVDKYYILTYNIRNHGSYTNIPLLSSPLNDYRFSPIEPKELYTNISINFAIVKFISIKDSNHTLYFKKENMNIWHYYTHLDEIQFSVPDNNNLSEKWIIFPFTTGSVYKMKLEINSKSESTPAFTISFEYNVTKQISSSRIPSINSIIPDNKERIDIDQNQPNSYQEGFANASKLILKKGKDIYDSIDLDKAAAKITEIMNNLKEMGRNAYDNFDANETKKKITELSNKLILMSKEMYDNFDSESKKEKLKESMNGLISKVNDLSDSIDPKDIQKKLINLTDSMLSYGKQIIDKIDFEKAKEKIKGAADHLVNKGKQIYNDFDYNETKQNIKNKTSKFVDKVKQMYNDFDYNETKKIVKNKTNNLIDKGKQMYNDFDYNETKQKVKNTVKNKYDQTSKFVKSFFAKDDDNNTQNDANHDL